MSTIWFNGKLSPEEDIRISLLTHALHYGTSAFEGIRFYKTADNRAIFRLREHIERLLRSSAEIGMETGYTVEELVQATIQTVAAHNYESGYIRPLVWYGEGGLGIGVTNNKTNTAIIVLPWGKYLPKELVSIVTVPTRRPNPNAFNLNAKLGGMYINSVTAHRLAALQGYDEALLLTDSDEVAEGAGQNIFIVKNNTLITPKLGNILPGITRESVIKLAQDLSISVEEQVLTLDDIYTADECFFTGTATEITPIQTVDDHLINEKIGPITDQLKRKFISVVSGQDQSYSQWLTVVD